MKNRTIFTMFDRNPLLSTGNCKISDFSEKDNLGGFKIEFFSRPTVNLILDFAYELIGQG